jgi:intermediate cleaving peptidase 55
MLDGGCLYKQYSSDITRLWPINGRFSSSYRQLYEILLTVQKDLIRHLNSDNRTITRQQLNTLTDQYLIKYLREELILSHTIDDYHAKRIINYLSPTSVSHHLGLDVHDCESLSFTQSLEKGNVITIEPGKYFRMNF